MVSMVNAALTTQMAIDHFQIDAIIFAGIAGAVDPALHPGDVVVPAYWIHQIESDWSTQRESTGRCTSVATR